MSLLRVLDLYREYASRVIDRRQFEIVLADHVMGASPVSPSSLPPSEQEELALGYKLSEAVCGMDGPDEDVDLLVNRVLSCVDQISDVEVVLDLLPLIKHHDRFSILVAKHQRGLISRAGMLSIVRKQFPFDSCRGWLEAASCDGMIGLCHLIEADDFAGAYALLSEEPEGF